MSCDHLNGGLYIPVHERGAWLRRCLMCGHAAPASAPDLPEDAGKAAALGFMHHGQRRFAEAEAAFFQAAGISADPRCHYAALMCRLGVVFCGDAQQPTFYAAHLPWQPLTESPEWLAVQDTRDGLSEAAWHAMTQQLSTLEEILRCIRLREGRSACDVFLCYRRSRDNVLRALTLYRDLTRQGLHVFCADVTTRGKTQEQFEAEVYHALRTAEHLVLLPGDGEDALTPWLHNELERAVCPPENRFLASDGHQSLPGGLGQAYPMSEISRLLSAGAARCTPESLLTRAASALGNADDGALPLLRRASAADNQTARLLLAQLYTEGFSLPQSGDAAAHYRTLAGTAAPEHRQQVFDMLSRAEQSRGVSRPQALLYIVADVSDAGVLLSQTLLKHLWAGMTADRRLASAQVCLVGYDRHARMIEAPKLLSRYGAPETAAQRLCSMGEQGRDGSAYAAKGIRCAANHLLQHPAPAGQKPLMMLLRGATDDDAPHAIPAALQSADAAFGSAQVSIIDAPAQIPGCIAAMLRALD